MLRPGSEPSPRASRDRILRYRLWLAQPAVWPCADGQCPLCGDSDPAPTAASRYRGVAAHPFCAGKAFPPLSLATLGLRVGGRVPHGWPYVAIVEHVDDTAAHARTLGAYRDGETRPGSVLLVAGRFGELLDAVAYRGEPVASGAGFLVPLSAPLELGPADFLRVHIRRFPQRRGL